MQGITMDHYPSIPERFHILTEAWKVDVPVNKHLGWEVKKFEVEMGLRNLRLMRDGRGSVPGEYTMLLSPEGDIVMSDTTAEIIDHLPLLSAVRELNPKCVLINGLGLGLCLNMILSEGVEEVLVVEKEQAVLDLVGSHYEDERVTFIKADALTYEPPGDLKLDMVWHDIWNTINEDNSETIELLNNKYAGAQWQQSWCEMQVYSGELG